MARHPARHLRIHVPTWPGWPRVTASRTSRSGRRSCRACRRRHCSPASAAALSQPATACGSNALAARHRRRSRRRRGHARLPSIHWCKRPGSCCCNGIAVRTPSASVFRYRGGLLSCRASRRNWGCSSTLCRWWPPRALSSDWMTGCNSCRPATWHCVSTNTRHWPTSSAGRAGLARHCSTPCWRSRTTPWPRCCKVAVTGRASVCRPATSNPTTP
ncbi:hypothetical protein D3C81_583110 [compost metagenome]